MVQLVVAFRRSLRFVALASCSVALVAIASPVSAKPQHGAGRHAHAHHAGHHARHHHSHRHDRHIARASQARARCRCAGQWLRTERCPRRHGQLQRVRRAQCGHRNAPLPARRARLALGAWRGADAGARHCQRPGQRRTQRQPAPPRRTADSFGSSSVVAEARRYIGGNPTGRGRLWCARFMNMVLERSGHRGTGSDMARSFASYGQRVSGPQVGAIAVMTQGTPRRPCRRGQRHRRPGQSDRGLRQQWQPGPGSAGLARPDLRLRDAELSEVSVPPRHCEPTGRACAPDDRLREAIHLIAQRNNGLLRRKRSSQ